MKIITAQEGLNIVGQEYLLKEVTERTLPTRLIAWLVGALFMFLVAEEATAQTHQNRSPLAQAGDSQAGDILYQLPAGWFKLNRGESAALLNAPLSRASIYLSSRELTTDFRDWFEHRVQYWVKDESSVTRGPTLSQHVNEGYDIMFTTLVRPLVVKGVATSPEDADYFVFFGANPGMRAELIMFAANTKANYQRHLHEFLEFVKNIRFANLTKSEPSLVQSNQPASNQPAQPGQQALCEIYICGLYMGMKTGLRYNPWAKLTQSYADEVYYWFSPDGRVHYGLPSGGLDAFDWGRDRRENPGKSGTYALSGRQIHFKWGDGESSSDRFERSGSDLRIDGITYNRINQFTGLRLSGLYSREQYTATDSGVLASERRILFRADGSFQQQGEGLTFVPGQDGRGWKEKGSGQYSITGNTMVLRYTDGRTVRVTFFVDPQNESEARPKRIFMNDQPLMLQRRLESVHRWTVRSKKQQPVLNWLQIRTLRLKRTLRKPYPVHFSAPIRSWQLSQKELEDNMKVRTHLSSSLAPAVAGMTTLAPGIRRSVRFRIISSLVLSFLALAPLWSRGSAFDVPRSNGSPMPVVIPDRPFEIVAIGDSVMWGQGLRTDQKFTEKVRKQISVLLGNHQVNLHVFAHSGGRITPPTGDPTLETVWETWPGEIARPFPSITYQAKKAASSVVPENVDLVLVDGGINDMRSVKILDPTVDANWIKSQAERYCREPMKNLLTLLGSQFPNARIIVTDYFPIISEQTSLTDFPALAAVLPILLGHPLTGWANLLVLRSKLTENSRAWADESYRSLWWAISQVNPAVRPPVPGNDPDDHHHSDPTPTTGNISDSGRVWLAGVYFDPQNCYAAPQSWAFKIKPAVGMPPAETNDDAGVRSERIQSCAHYQGQMDTVGRLECPLTAAFHPNSDGADAYARSIMNVVARFRWSWSPWFVPPSQPSQPRLPTLELSIAPKPVMNFFPPRRALQESRVTVHAVDSLTHQTVTGTVWIDGRQVEQTDIEFRYTFEAVRSINRRTGGVQLVCPNLTVRVAGYLEASLDLCAL